MKGVLLPDPFQVAAQYLTIGNYTDFHWPTLAELNDEFEPYLWRNDNKCCSFMNDNAPFSPFFIYRTSTILTLALAF